MTKETGVLAGKRALVTGGSRGIGRAIAEAFAREGARVCINYVSRPSDAEEIVSNILAQFGEAFSIKCNVTDESEIKAMFDELDTRFGGLDILVNNAGVILEKDFLKTTAADFDRLMGINLRGTFLVGREAARRMVRQGQDGRVINLSSDLGFLGREQYSIYCASKGAINALTKSLARELAPRILVNAIAPGPVDTDMLSLSEMSPEWREKEENIPLKRVGSPEEVAAVAVFLSGPSASFITGQIIGPNGGSVMP